MDLAWCFGRGITRVSATCDACRHSALVDVSGWPPELYVPDVGLRLRCSACGGREIDTRPDWTQYRSSGMPGYRARQ